jgi:hypothetical protein
MAAHWVVVGLDVLEHVGLGVVPSPVADAVDLLDLQRVEKAFHRRVVVAVTLTPQTLLTWVRQHERDTGLRDGVTTAERERIKE